MPSDPAPDDLTEVDLLMRVARQWRHTGARAAAGHGGGLTPHQQRALLSLHRHAEEGVRVSGLAEHLGITPRSATEVADALEAAGLLTRSPDHADRRAVLLRLSTQGRRRAEQVRVHRTEAAERAVSRLDPADRRELRRLLLALLD